MKALCNTYREIQEYYLSQSQFVCDIVLEKNPVVLKTDLYNEANSTPMLGGVIKNLRGCKTIIGVEYQKHVVDKAITILGNDHNNLFEGDIRRLPFNKNTFDVVLDLSTLDHIMPSEVDIVLSGYSKILKDNGMFFLVTWIDALDRGGEAAWNPNNQYYFNKDALEESMKKYFSIDEIVLVFIDPGNQRNYLYSYLCRKNATMELPTD